MSAQVIGHGQHHAVTEQIPDEIAAELTFTTVSRMEEVLDVALGADNLAALRSQLKARPVASGEITAEA